MIYSELHNRYGSHVALRVQEELTPQEFNKVTLKDLQGWLEARAENLHRQYEVQMENPLDESLAEVATKLYKSWQGAEELSYIVNVAEDIGQKARKVRA